MPLRPFLLLPLLLIGCAPVAAPRPAPPAAAPAAPASSLPAAAPTPAASPPPATGLLVPLYEPPSSAGWPALASLARRHPAVPIVAIVNPDNGPPWGPAPELAAQVATLQAAGVTVVGYLSTGYGKRLPAKVEADVGRWRAYVPGLDGLFLDEFANEAAARGFYAAIVAQAHGAGFAKTIGNAGTTPLASLAALVDTVVVYEKAGLPAAGAGAALPQERQAALSYDVPRFDAAGFRAAAGRFGWLYVTERGGSPDPWGRLSGYMEQMAGQLDPPGASPAAGAEQGAPAVGMPPA